MYSLIYYADKALYCNAVFLAITYSVQLFGKTVSVVVKEVDTKLFKVYVMTGT